MQESPALNRILMRVHIENEYIARLSAIMDSDPNDCILRTMCIHYSMMELYSFVQSLEELQDRADDNKKLSLEHVMPLIDWLKNYKEGLRRYRNKRVAHHDDLNKDSMVYFREFDLPSSILDLKKLYKVITFLRIYIDAMYVDNIPKLIRKLKEDKQEEEQKPYPINHNANLNPAKAETMNNIIRIKDLFPDGAFKPCMDALEDI